MKAIGKYQLLQQIGAGAAGITYRARDTFRNRELALKVLHSTLVANPEWKEQFSTELGLCADLRNSIFVKILDLGEVEDVIYIATDLLTGVDLRCHLAEQRILTLDQNLEYIAQVCDGLAFAHSKGIAHGNIKPSNLFVIAGKDARILDLGLAGWLASVLAVNGQHLELFPNYFAPEQILGEKFDARSDIFSVGVVLYELLTQKYPFAADANLIPREIVHSEPEPLRKLKPELPEELEQLVMRALHKDPGQRLASAEEFGASLVRMAQKLQDEESPSSSLSMTPRPSAAEALRTSPRPEAAPAVASPVAAEAQPLSPRPSAPDGALEQTPRPPSPPLKPTVPASTAPSVPVAAPAAAKPEPAFPSAAPPKAAKRPPMQVLQSASGLLQKPVALIAAAAVLALCIVVIVISRQGLRASPPAIAAPAAAVQAATPAAEVKAVPPPAPPPVPAEEAAVPKPTPEKTKAEPHEPSPGEVLRGQVKPLWESGKYDQALRLVNGILADTPDQAEALAWKKKIRAAQQAEAAIK